MFFLSPFPITVKKGSRVSRPHSPAGMSLTKLPLGRNNSVMTSLYPPRESLAVTSRLGRETPEPFFYGVLVSQVMPTNEWVRRGSMCSVPACCTTQFDCKTGFGSLLALDSVDNWHKFITQSRRFSYLKKTRNTAQEEIDERDIIIQIKQ